MTCTIEISPEHSHTEALMMSELLTEKQLNKTPHELLTLVIKVKKGAVLTLVDDLHVHCYLSTQVEFLVEEDATLTCSLLMNEAVDSIFDRRYRSVVSTTVINKTITVRLLGSRAQANIYGSCLGYDKRIFNIKTIQDHQAPHAQSTVIIKGILDDESLLSCHSLIYVAPKAQGTVAVQANKNILLSSQAKALSIPTLEVLAHEVSCKHGAAVSNFDEEQIFYLKSRGMTEIAAKRMLIAAFLS